MKSLVASWGPPPPDAHAAARCALVLLCFLTLGVGVNRARADLNLGGGLSVTGDLHAGKRLLLTGKGSPPAAPNGSEFGLYGDTGTGNLYFGFGGVWTALGAATALLNTTTFVAPNGNNLLVGSEQTFNVKRYGARGDAGTLLLTLNGGSVTGCNDGTIACSTFTTAKYGGATIKIPNALETSMVADTGATLNGTITNAQSTLSLNAPAVGTSWATVLPAGETSMLIDSELIGCSAVTGNSFSGCVRASERTTAAGHTTGAAVRIYAFDTVNAGDYTAVHSYSWPWHSFLDTGRKIVLPSAGWTYTNPGTIDAMDPAGYSGANETGWYARVEPVASTPGTGQTGSIFSAELATISTISGVNPSFSSTNGTMSANIVNQLETAIVGHDDTAAVQAAIDAAAAAGGGTVTFPYGSYLIGGALTGTSHVHIDVGTSTIYTALSATGPETDINAGGSGLPTMLSVQGSITMDDAQMSTFSYNSGIVSPVQFAANGTLSESTTYYYKVSCQDNSVPPKETAASSTMNFGRPSAGNDTLEYTLLRSPDPDCKTYRIWRSDGLDSADDYKWGLLRTVAFNAVDEWTDGDGDLMGLKDTGSATPNTAIHPPTTNGFTTPVTDFSWTGGTIIGSEDAQYILLCNLGTNIHVTGLHVQSAGTVAIKLQSVANASIRDCVLEHTGEGILVENSQHILVEHNHLSYNGFLPAQTYHAQGFAAVGGSNSPNSTQNAPTDDVEWNANEIDHGCQDAGEHCQQLMGYGVVGLRFINNYIHDAWVDANDSFQSKGGLWSPAINHSTTQAMRLRDAEAVIQGNRIVAAGNGLLIDSQLDFEDLNINGTNSTPYDDRPLEGGRTIVSGNVFERCDAYGINVTNSSLGSPTASISPSVKTGTYSTCPVGRDGALLTQMSTYAVGQAFAPEMIPPVTITGNQFLHTGMDIPSIEGDSILLTNAYSQITNNLFDGSSSAAVIVNLDRPPGAVFEPTDVVISGNTVHNIGRGTLNNIDWKVGIFYLGLRGHINGNTLVAQDSGSYSGAVGIKLGYSGAAPWTANSYSADVSGNTLTNFPTAILTDPPSGQTAIALDTTGNGRLSGNAGTALTTADFGTLTGWGTGATITSVASGSTDSSGQVTITAGTTPSANPTVTLTFHDGAWSTAPFAVASMDGSSTGTLGPVAAQTTSTTLKLTFIGTPAAGSYKLSWTARQ